MKENTTTKQGRKAGGNPIESSTPTGHEEMAANSTAEQTGSDTPPDKLQPKRKTQDRKPQEPTQKLNPKRNSNSRPD